MTVALLSVAAILIGCYGIVLIDETCRMETRK